MTKNDYFLVENYNYWGLILPMINSNFAFFFMQHAPSIQPLGLYKYQLWTYFSLIKVLPKSYQSLVD